ncbi:hypothetical protein P3X46_032330 [Hevea brasiliensis]|uniref:DUF4005 domain-containing protein n=1 Tax=Hevea brasiliensis TaxID=3981 RepID=A0ABQ9KEW5_HEVBR|nr:uncharacterized protein LOC110661587 [Hevea brasiliensis]KAJ9135111.1 hypothetical protein P3X46_032330 [Hevea brasiliensis]
MVLWEITLGTAYFLGLKRTYRLALRIQRRLVSPKRPKIRQFLHRRTRAVFDVALKVHQNIQQRDIEVGRNLGNWILRWLDRMKPSAQIRGPLPMKPPNGANTNVNMKKQVTSSSHLKTSGSIQSPRSQDSSRHLFTASRNMWSQPFPAIAMMMRPPRPAGTITQYRHLCISGRPDYIGGASSFEGVIRKDIMQYLLQN